MLLRANYRAYANIGSQRTFLSVTSGTTEPAKFLEMSVSHKGLLYQRSTNDENSRSHYKGAADPSAQPLAFVGKGITFDTGGISLKPGAVSFFSLFILCGTEIDVACCRT